jgi:signal transduction histidine kinase
MAAAAPTAMRADLAHDLCLSVAVAVLLLIGSGVSLEDDFAVSLADGHGWPWLPGPVGMLFVLAGSLPLIFRRVAPLPVFAVTAVASMAYPALGYHPEPLPLGVLVALYTLAVTRRPLVSSAAAAAFVFTFTVGALTGWVPLTDDQYYIDLVSVVATVMLGYGVALGRTSTRLAKQRGDALSRDHESRMRAAVEQEQARIAREVHDIVAHDMSVIVAQAAVARRAVPAPPQATAESLASIEAVGRDALDGLRRLMNLLRTESAQAERSPQPDLDRIPWLVSQVEKAGLPVELTIRGEPTPLPATVEVNAFRIVQEALTNTLKHAGPTRASVTLDYDDESLGVEVLDEGPRPDGPRHAAPPSSGFGMISMHQRAAMLGGELVAEPGSDHGFRVAARLPLAEHAR